MIASFLLAGLIGSGLFNASHDITTLPAWGPYAKEYAGISHVSDVSSGKRMDFFLVPGFYRRDYRVPNMLMESAVYPWDFRRDLRRITWRQEVEWKDFVYVDATYSVLDEGTVLLEMHCVNNTRIPQNILLSTMGALRYAEDYPRLRVSGADAVLGALEYDSYEPAVRGHDYALVYDGALRGEKTDPESVRGRVLAFSGRTGDRVVYTLPAHSGPVRLRCKAPEGSRVQLKAGGTTVSVEGSGRYELIPVDCPGTRLELESASDGALRLDALILGDGARVEDAPLQYEPQLQSGKGWFLARYEALPDCYGVAWNFPRSSVNEYVNSDLDVFLRRTVHNHPPHRFVGDWKGHYTAAYQRPLSLQPHTDTTVYNLIACGSEAFVKGRLAAFNADEKPFVRAAEALAGGPAPTLPEAEPYRNGERFMEATLLANIVYPVRTQGQYIRHFTPGKHWNSLYTWDSGFISWALTQIDPVKAFETIRAYTTGEESQSAFIHHGTPLPTQFFAFAELCNRGLDDNAIAWMYPRLWRYYGFLSGHNPDSRTVMPSGLLRTWDYFYNSGGWDDYPPQHYLRLHPELYPSVSPVVSTAWCIRAARILRLAARRLGRKADVKTLDADIARMSAALERCWDEEEGWYGYACHDDKGAVSGTLRYPGGGNFNRGLDGVTPLTAGVAGPAREERLLRHIFSEKELWTPYGITAVDQSAPYYDRSGYWNGTVWMPHQLVLWKTMLDLGKPELAQKIAVTALETYNKECNKSYLSFEHFDIATGRGAGWHNFSGLTSPMVNWYHAYFVPGTVSTGFDLLLSEGRWTSDRSGYEAKVLFDRDAAGHTPSVLLCLSPEHDYTATLDGKAVALQSPWKGLVCLSLPAGKKEAKLIVKPVN
ncbi:MAG: glycoside hydrolase [Bacteroidales bacterium]|nr:glycoside hydrolase [Bacteroidales bacterium]